jgi:hypothetical protein
MRLILTIFTVLLLVPASAVAASGWEAPQTIGTASGGAEFADTDVAVDDRGSAVAVWSATGPGRDAVYAARASSGARFGRATLVRGQRGNLDDARVAFDGDRNAVVAYRRFTGGNHRVASRTLTPGGRLLGEQLLSGGGASAFEPLFARTVGDAPIVSWRRSPPRADDLRAELATAQEGGRFEQRVRYDFPDAPQAFVVAGGPADERVVATVRRVPDSARGEVVVGLPVEGSTTLDLRTVSGGRRTVREVALTVTRAGRIVVAWTENVGGRQAILVADRPRGGTFGPPRQILAPDRYIDQLTLVTTGEDTARAAWITAPARNAFRLRRGVVNTARLGVGGDDGPPRDVSTAGREVEAFTIAPDGRGGATVLWLSDVAAEPGGPLEARAITAQGRFGRVQRLTARAERAVAAALGVGAQGAAAAVWTVAGGERIRAARRPG